MSGRDAAAGAAARQAMVARQLRERGVADVRVLAALERVPREAFVPDDQRDSAFADAALPIACHQTISQPYIVGRMTELAAVVAGDRVLDVGTGSGYQAAILAEVGCHVTSIERHPALADEARQRLARLGYAVEVVVGDGSLGWPSGAPWDAIVVAAAAPAIPDALREQLGIGRRLVLPVGPRDHQELVVVTRRSATEWTERSDGPVIFVPLVGAAGFGEG